MDPKIYNFKNFLNPVADLIWKQKKNTKSVQSFVQSSLNLCVVRFIKKLHYMEKYQNCTGGAKLFSFNKIRSGMIIPDPDTQKFHRDLIKTGRRLRKVLFQGCMGFNGNRRWPEQEGVRYGIISWMPYLSTNRIPTVHKLTEQWVTSRRVGDRMRKWQQASQMVGRRSGSTSWMPRMRTTFSRLLTIPSSM